MIYQESTFHDNYNIKSYIEKYYNQLIVYEEYDENGHLTYHKSSSAEYHRKNNKTIGEFKAYWDNGAIYLLANYNQDGLRHGRYAQYYENGILAMCVYFFNGKKEGIQTTYTLDGKLVSMRNYKEGNPYDLQTEYYQNGFKAREYFYNERYNREYHLKWDESGNLIFDSRNECPYKEKKYKNIW